MTGRSAYLYVLDTLADWEPGLLIAELNTGRFFADQGERIPVRTVGATREPVTTMGGLRLTPELTLDELDPTAAAVLILPGAETWLDPAQEHAVRVARTFLAAGVPVAAICGATMALAQAGMLDERAHTSNDLGALQGMCPGYRGQAHYVDRPAVADGDLITATGAGPVHFAHAVLGRLGVFSPDALDAWFRLNLDREPQAYHDLMAAVPGPQEAPA